MTKNSRCHRTCRAPPRCNILTRLLSHSSRVEQPYRAHYKKGRPERVALQNLINRKDVILSTASFSIQNIALPASGKYTLRSAGELL